MAKAIKKKVPNITVKTEMSADDLFSLAINTPIKKPKPTAKGKK